MTGARGALERKEAVAFGVSECNEILVSNATKLLSQHARFLDDKNYYKGGIEFRLRQPHGSVSQQSAGGGSSDMLVRELDFGDSRTNYCIYPFAAFAAHCRLFD